MLTQLLRKVAVGLPLDSHDREDALDAFIAELRPKPEVQAMLAADRMLLLDNAMMPLQCCLLAGRKVAAVKLLRSITGWGLKECKDYVEDLPVLKGVKR